MKKRKPSGSVNNQDGEIFRCDKCGSMFLSKKTFARHMQCHGGKKGDKIKKKKKSRSKKTRPNYATASKELRGWPVQGGAPGLGKKS